MILMENWRILMSRKYKIGDRFLIPEITRTITEINESFIQKQTIKNGIAVITESHVNNDDGCEYYYLKINDEFGLFYIGENSLEKYDMIISQGKNTKLDSCFEEKFDAVSNPEQVLNYLKEKSKIGYPGMMGTEVYVEKEMLKLASAYLEDLWSMCGVL
jgi:hypothetical protein